MCARRVFHLLIQVDVPASLCNVRRAASRTLTVAGTITVSLRRAIHNTSQKVQEETEVLLPGYVIHQLPITRCGHGDDGLDEPSQLVRGVDDIVCARVLIESQHGGI